MSSHSFHSARPLVEIPSFNTLLTNIGNMPMLPDDSAAHRGRARLTSSPVHYQSPTRPRTEQSVHAYPSQGLMPPAQIRHGRDVRAPERSRHVILSDREAADTLMFMRSGGTPRKPEVSQNRAPALPSVERYERPKTPTRVSFLPPITPDRLRADSSWIHCSPSTWSSPSQAQLIPVQPSHPKSMNNPAPIRDANAQSPIQQEPWNDAELSTASIAPKRTLTPLVDKKQPHLKWLGQRFVPMFQLMGPNQQRCDLQSASCFRIAESGLPIDKVELKQRGYRDVGLDVATPEIILSITWPGYPAEIGCIRKVMRPVHGAFSEITIALMISMMVEELAARVHKSGAPIDPKFHTYELNKKLTTRNLRFTHLLHCFQNVYQPLLCFC
ncbi:hypothetical protein BD410DRAFT_836225 [Rickenella mellea]|uniref:Uncharacterized protein n=1 Tax=Rickenella mellea TaxID=50990 RepID=A0A4Y7QIT7_9AGAM|nr:hypothetical protein BD410DRAFT_836225 [Rickenella mellea]